VGLGRKNFRLALDVEGDEGSVALPLARVRRDGSGSFVYDADYVPPALQIGASPQLLELVARVVDVLDEKSAALAAARRASGVSLGEFASNELASFWLLHTIYSAMAPLRHQLQVRRTRPEALYLELARLAGALCTFSLDADARALPAYDHDRLGEVFGTLEQHIRAHLEVVLPTNAITVPLRQVETYMWNGGVTDTRCFGRARWFLGVASAVGEAEVIRRVPTFVKVCSAEGAPKLVARAWSGLTLTHVPVPPAAISPRVDLQYFSISQAGGCWEHMRLTNDVGIYVPDALPGPELELKVMLES
jgi:type VI secretion system protein ImpJ